MKGIVSIFLLLSLAVVSISCESEQEKYQRLTKEYEKTKVETLELENEWKRLEKEQRKCWQSTAKDRMGFMHEIQNNKWKTLEYEDYIKAIHIESKHSKKYKIVIRIKPLEKVKPYFLVYLCNREGLIVGNAEIKGFWKVGAGKDKEYSKTISTSETAYYYRLDILR